MVDSIHLILVLYLEKITSAINKHSNIGNVAAKLRKYNFFTSYFVTG